MIVLITGATSGIGKSCAELFSKKGYKLIIIGRLPNQKFKRKLHDVINSAPSPENIQILGHINFLQLNKRI